MRHSIFTASAAALLLSSGAVFAQDAQQSGQIAFENVFVDIDGSAVQVPVALAAEACALDVTTLQQVAQGRLDEVGVMGSSIPGLMMADAGAAAGLDASGGLSDIEASSMETADSMTTGAPADSAGSVTTGTDIATADAPTAGMTDGAATTADASRPAEVNDDSTMAAANSPAGTTDPSAADSAGAMETTTADASVDGSASTDLSGVSGVASTAADTTASEAQGAAGLGLSEQYIELAVCQIDSARASELGISGLSNTTATE